MVPFAESAIGQLLRRILNQAQWMRAAKRAAISLMQLKRGHRPQAAISTRCAGRGLCLSLLPYPITCRPTITSFHEFRQRTALSIRAAELHSRCQPDQRRALLVERKDDEPSEIDACCRPSRSRWPDRASCQCKCRSAFGGVVTVKSDYSVAETVSRIKRDVAKKGIMFFGVIDQAKLGNKAGNDVKPSRLVMFGNPALGTTFITANSEAGLDGRCECWSTRRRRRGACRLHRLRLDREAPRHHQSRQGIQDGD